MLEKIKKGLAFIKKKYDMWLRSHYDSFILEYDIQNSDIILKSTRGKVRKVQNNRINVAKINRAIIKEKIAAHNKIDEYETHSNERMKLLLGNMLLEMSCGGLVILSFFTGVYAFLLFSVALLIITSISVSLMLFRTYIEIMEISELKKVTGYKREYEFNVVNPLTLLKK